MSNLKEECPVCSVDRGPVQSDVEDSSVVDAASDELGSIVLQRSQQVSTVTTPVTALRTIGMLDVGQSEL